MSRIEWVVLAGIGALVVLMIAIEPDHDDMVAHEHPVMAAVEPAPNASVLNLAVTGMT
jgi:hypothetical protein